MRVRPSATDSESWRGRHSHVAKLMDEAMNETLSMRYVQGSTNQNGIHQTRDNLPRGRQCVTLVYLQRLRLGYYPLGRLSG
jgi:hypothetical protein